MSKLPEVARTAATRVRRHALPDSITSPRRELPLYSSTPPKATATDYVDNETYNKRRRILWAGGIAVIAGAGALLGAQLKTYTETNEKQRQRTQVTTSPAVDTSKSTVEGSSGSNSLRTTPKPNVANTIDQRIEALERTKSSLQVQKGRLQEKIERLQARKLEKQDMEARRRVDVNR